jgi:predicted PurR-regulated permease PerM
MDRQRSSTIKPWRNGQRAAHQGNEIHMPDKQTIHTTAFVTLVVVITVAFIWLLLPFYGAILWAIILAILFDPLQRRLVVGLRGRRSLAAGLSVLACVAIVLIPAMLILATLSVEAAALYNKLQSSNFDLAAVLTQARDSLPGFVRSALAGVDLTSLADIQENLGGLLSGASRTLASGALGAGQSTVKFLISLAIMLYLLFFLFRDGPSLILMLRNAVPLARNRTDRIGRKFVSVAKATVRGNILIALIQGGLGGLAFWLLGLEAPLLWGVVMAVLSLLPAVGAFLVWGPFAAYLLFSGDYTRGIILILVGALVISTVDNLLRPVLVGRETRMPDYLVLISTLGGLSVFGANGFILGPMVAALFISVWSLFTEDRLNAGSQNSATPV